MGCLKLSYHPEELKEENPHLFWKVYSKKGKGAEKSISYLRYGYQGQFSMEDMETGWNSFELRNYDAVIGRWLVTDPAGQYYSPYMSFGNNPIMRVDPDGGFDWFVNQKTGEVVHAAGQGADYASELGSDYAWFAEDGAFMPSSDFLGMASMRLDGSTLIRSWDLMQSELMMTASNYMLVPTMAFVNETSLHMYLNGLGQVTNTTITSVYETMTYVPSGYYAKEYTRFTEIISPFSANYLRTYQYTKINPARNAYDRSSSILNFIGKITDVFSGNNGSGFETIRPIDYKGWSNYPKNGVLYDYRPGGEGRFNIMRGQ